MTSSPGRSTVPVVPHCDDVPAHGDSFFRGSMHHTDGSSPDTLPIDASWV